MLHAQIKNFNFKLNMRWLIKIALNKLSDKFYRLFKIYKTYQFNLLV